MTIGLAYWYGVRFTVRYTRIYIERTRISTLKQQKYSYKKIMMVCDLIDLLTFDLYNLIPFTCFTTGASC